METNSTTKSKSSAVLNKAREICSTHRTSIIIMSVTTYHILASVAQILTFETVSSMVKDCKSISKVFSESAAMGLSITFQVILFIQVSASLMMVHALSKKSRKLFEIWLGIVICISFFYAIMNVYESTLFWTCQGVAEALGLLILLLITVGLGGAMTKSVAKVAGEWPKEGCARTGSPQAGLPTLQQSSPA